MLSNPHKDGLTTEQEKELVTTLNNFIKWLEKKKIVESLAHIDHTVDWPFANEDWVMKVTGNQISFNTLIIKRCSFQYYKVVVLHEFFHLSVQKVPNKEDAIRIKDDFGDQLMKLIDIEADYFTAAYCKEELGYDLVSYLELYYEGSVIFTEKWVRAVKLERFIGTMLSITKMFIDHPKKEDKILVCDLYLPSISPIYTEKSLHVIVLRKEHIYFAEIEANYKDFASIKKCYQEINSISVKKYIQTLVNFSTKALKLKIPVRINNEIGKLSSKIPK